MTTLALLILAALIGQADASFDCRRPQQPCKNSGICIFTNPFCTGCGANEAYDCGVVTSEIVTGCTDCLNGGTCINSGGGNECYCADTHYGTTCELARLNVFCEVDKMTIGINPHGDFTNGIIYVEGKRTEATCLGAVVPDPVDPADSIPDEWLGYALAVDHTNADCGAITVAMDGANSVYTRTFVVQYDEKVITTLEDKLEVKCVFDPNNVLIESSVLQVDDADLTGLKSSTVEGQFTPATLVIKSGGTAVDPAVPLVIGTEVEFTFEVPAEYAAITVMEGTASNNDDGTPKTLKLVTAGCMDADAFHVTVATPARDATNKIVTMTIKIFQFYGFTDVKFEFTVRVCLTSNTGPCDAVTCGSGTQFGRRKREAQTFNETMVEGVVKVMNPVQFKEYEQRKAEAECGTSKEITAAMIIMGIVILTLLTLSLILIAKIAISRKSRAQSKQDLYSAGSVQSMPTI